MALTDSEIAKVFYHLGYPDVTLGAAIGLGMPTLVQALFPVENAIAHLRSRSETQVRALITQCDASDAAIAGVDIRLSAKAVGDIQLRDNELDLREQAYKRWCRRLSELTGIPINPTSRQASDGFSCAAVH